LKQVQAGDAYRLPIEIGITETVEAVTTTPNSPTRASPRPLTHVRIERIVLADREGRFTIAADRAPQAVQLDPNTLMLMDGELAAPPAAAKD
jgi:DNA/RNA endonuclease YhcR with UshA esterase domain